MDLDHKLCYCFHISKRKIVNFVKRERPKRASQISECFGAGTGCGWCIPFLKKLHQEIVGGEAIESGSISAQDYEQLRSRYLSQVREGTREKNRHGSAPQQDPLVTKDDLDYTRYFSTARHDPPPDTLQEDPEATGSEAADADDVGP